MGMQYVDIDASKFVDMGIGVYRRLSILNELGSKLPSGNKNVGG